VLKEAIEVLVRMLSPFAPHMAEELWERSATRRHRRRRLAGVR
jgi:leucyl-tRNA synthetase